MAVRGFRAAVWTITRAARNAHIDPRDTGETAAAPVTVSQDAS
jgi:hypothetical protein